MAVRRRPCPFCGGAGWRRLRFRLLRHRSIVADQGCLVCLGTGRMGATLPPEAPRVVP